MKVSVISQIYNTPEAYIRQAIESVLDQTYPDFEYVIIDNGCTDGTADILREYADKDSRIRLIRYDRNRVMYPHWYYYAKDQAKSEYVAMLDSDDWLEPKFLERLLQTAEETGADMVCTGVVREYSPDDIYDIVGSESRIVIDRGGYANDFVKYFWFCRMYWNKLIRTEIVKKSEIPDFERLDLVLGTDTIMVFQMLRHCRLLVLDDSVLQHYRLNPHSLSRVFDPRRFEAHLYRFKYLIAFLQEYGKIGSENLRHLCNSITAGVNRHIQNLLRSDRSSEEKLRELRKISTNEIMNQILTLPESNMREVRDTVLLAALTMEEIPEASSEDFVETVRALLPLCGKAVFPSNAALFAEEMPLLDALLADEPERLLNEALELLSAGHPAAPELAGIAAALSDGDPLLAQVCDPGFLRGYGDVYLTVWNRQYAVALDRMIGLLLDGRGRSDTFFQLFLSLAALLDHPSAFLFGKVQAAAFALERGRRDECRAILEELTEMGMVETEDVAALRQALAEAEG